MLKLKKEIIYLLEGITLILIILVLFIMLIGLFNRNKMTDLETSLLSEQNKTTMIYMDSIDVSKKELDSYILYVLEYSYNENDKNSLKCSEIKTLIKELFDKDVTEEELNAVGVTPLLLDNKVGHNIEEKTFIIDKSDLTQRSIANIPIVVYQQKKAKKRGFNYIVEYNKVTISNPYEILNYYNDLSTSEPDKEPYDTTKIMNYLTAKGKIKDIKRAVNDEIIEKVGKQDEKKTIITYKLVGAKFIIVDIQEK